MHCPRSSSGCSGMWGICSWLTGGSIYLLYICIVLDLAVGVAVCKASVLDWLGRATWNVMVFKASMLYWLGVHLFSIYMHYPRSGSGCSSMQGICARLTREDHMKCNGIQGICAWLTGEDLCLIALCYAHICGGLVVKAPILDWPG